MKHDLLRQILSTVQRLFFTICSLIIFIFAITIMLFSHDAWLLIIGVINNYPQVYFDILEDQLWWNIVDTCAVLYYYYYYISSHFVEINWNITCTVFITTVRALDFLIDIFCFLWISKLDLYYAIEMIAISLEVANNTIIAPFLALAYVHWFFSHVLYAILAFSCDFVLTVFFEDSEWIRSVFDTDFVNNSLRWYLPFLVLIIAALVLIRSSTPRYRYDYLSKIGWLKFFGISLGIIIIVVLIYFFW